MSTPNESRKSSRPAIVAVLLLITAGIAALGGYVTGRADLLQSDNERLNNRSAGYIGHLWECLNQFPLRGIVVSEDNGKDSATCAVPAELLPVLRRELLRITKTQAGRFWPKLIPNFSIIVRFDVPDAGLDTAYEVHHEMGRLGPASLDYTFWWTDESSTVLSGVCAAAFADFKLSKSGPTSKIYTGAFEDAVNTTRKGLDKLSAEDRRLVETYLTALTARHKLTD